MASAITFIKHNVLVSVVVAAVAVFAVYSFFFGGEGESGIDTVVVSQGDIIQEVSVTGRVKPAQAVDLAFEASGRVSYLPASVGDAVFAGQVLAALSSADTQALLASAHAKQTAEEAYLAELLRGSRPEEVRVAEVKVENAQTALADTRQNLVDKIRDGYSKADDAVRNKVDQLMQNPRGTNPQFSFSISDTKLKLDVEFGRFSLEQVLTSWGASVSLLSTGSNLEMLADEAAANLLRINRFLDQVGLAINMVTANSSLTQTTLDGYKTDIATARTNGNTAASNLSAAREKIKKAQSDLLLSQEELALTRAGAAAEDIAAQRALLEEAAANVRRYEAELAKATIRAPFAGVVVRSDSEVGETVSAASVVVSLISTAHFEIEANVPEADIANLKIGDTALVTLDAYGADVVFEASVMSIEPAERIIEGVPTYRTKLQFEKQDPRIRSGMTANIDIRTDKREGVFAVPARAVLSTDGNKILRVLKDDGSIEERMVETGMRGSLGQIEITKGLVEGERVIVFEP